MSAIEDAVTDTRQLDNKLASIRNEKPLPCGYCGRELAALEPVLRYPYGMSGFYPGHICQSCCAKKNKRMSGQCWPCEECGRDTFFVRRVKNRKLCSKRCESRFYRRMRRERRRYLCSSCHCSYQPERKDAKYCSERCRQKAYRQRKAADAASATWTPDL